jgi:hypothetical protein
MAFVASPNASYLAAGQVTVNLPLTTDASGNNGAGACMYSHVKITPASGAVSVVTTFDSRPGVNLNTLGAGDVWAIPMGAKVMTVTPTGGSATAQLGIDN